MKSYLRSPTKDLLSLGSSGPGLVTGGTFLSGSPMWKFFGKGPKSYSPGFSWGLYGIMMIGKVIDHWQWSSTSSPFPLPGEWMGGGTESSKLLIRRLVLLATSPQPWVGSPSHFIYITKDPFITLNSGNSRVRLPITRKYRKRPNIIYNIAGRFSIIMAYHYTKREKRKNKSC